MNRGFLPFFRLSKVHRRGSLRVFQNIRIPGLSTNGYWGTGARPRFGEERTTLAGLVWMGL